MFLARQIDAAARRWHGAGGPALGAVTLAVVRFYDRQARDLRAEAQAVVLQSLFRAPLIAFERLLAALPDVEPTRPRS